jgi:mannosyltransferase
MTTTLARPLDRPAAGASTRRRRSPLPAALGIVGFLAVFIGSWIPSFWGDEAASVLSAERSLPSLFRMLGHVDAVHGTYYLFLHFWIHVFGASEVSVRLPSAVAVGILTAGTFVLGRMLANRNIGIVAAIIVAVLPRTNYLGGDARSYAFSTAIAVWLTILLVQLMRHPFVSKRREALAWLAYAVVAAIGMYVFLYLGLLLVVHGAWVLSSRENRRSLRCWAQSAGVAVVLALPIAWNGYAERKQIAFLADRGYATTKSVLVTQWFGNPFLATAAWLLIASVIVMAVLTWRRTRTVAPLVALGLLWLVVPTGILLILNNATPAYNLRYVSFSVPGVALILAWGIWALRHRVLRVAAVVAIVALAVPTLVAQRGPYAKDGGSDWTQASAIIGQDAKPGDAIVFDRTTRPSERPRLAKYLYPAEYAGLVDVSLKIPHTERAGLWDTTYPLSDIGSRLNGIKHVWVVELKGSPDNTQGIDEHTLDGDGYTLVSKQLVHRTIIYSFTKTT